MFISLCAKQRMHLLKNCNKSLIEVYLLKGKSIKRHLCLQVPKKNPGHEIKGPLMVFICCSSTFFVGIFRQQQNSSRIIPSEFPKDLLGVWFKLINWKKLWTKFGLCTTLPYYNISILGCWSLCRRSNICWGHSRTWLEFLGC